MGSSGRGDRRGAVLEIFVIDLRHRRAKKSHCTGKGVLGACCTTVYVRLTILSWKLGNCWEGEFYVMCFFHNKKVAHSYFSFRMITAAGERRQALSRETCSVYYHH